MIHLILIEDDVFAQKGIKAGLLLTDAQESKFQFIATHTDGSTLLKLYEKYQDIDPVILLDLKLEDSRPGALAAEELLQAYPEAKVVIYSSHIDIITLIILRSFNILGFVCKGLNAKVLDEALDAASKGNMFFCNSCKDVFNSNRNDLSTLEKLSNSEKIIIYLRYNKFSFEDIAKFTNRTTDSVYSQHRRAVKKLDPSMKKILES